MTAPPTRKRPERRHPITEALKGRRLALGLTQRQVAALIPGCRQAEISAWETGRMHPTMVNIDRWATALGCELIVVECET